MSQISTAFSEQLNSLLRNLKYKELCKKIHLKPEEILIKQGDLGNGLYLLDIGILGVRVRYPDGTERIIDRHTTAGTIVGEMAIMPGQIRTATVYAESEATVRYLSRENLLKLVSENRHTMSALSETIGPRWQRLMISPVLEKLFGPLDPENIEEMLKNLHWRHLSRGKILCHEGEPASSMYILVSGQMKLKASSPNETEQDFGVIYAGETVGESALITNSPRSATVYAARNCNLVEISAKFFQELIQAYPSFLGLMLKALLDRQKRLIHQVNEAHFSAKAITIIPLNAGIQATQFALTLETLLSAFGKTLFLDNQRFDNHFGQQGAAQSDFNDPIHMATATWMTMLDREYDYLLFLADQDWTEWTQRCMNQADNIMLLADSTDNPKPKSVEQMLASMELKPSIDLVLIQPAGTTIPQNTDSWLAPRQLSAHYHVRQGDESHMARLARHVANKAVCLVLSGGGARGFAHLGVFKAIEELDIPIDYLGGTSMGSLMAGGIALDMSYSEFLAKAKVTANARSLFDYTLPFTSLMASKKVTQAVRNLYLDTKIEDLWIPYFCVSANLSRAEQKVHQRGYLWRAVRSSISLPAVFTPVMTDDEVIVDGGVMNNFPVDVMARLCPSTHIIGVNVSPPTLKKQKYDLSESISGWRILASKLNPFRKSLYTPSLAGIILRTMEINNVQQTRHNEELADLLIHPDVRQFGLLDFADYEGAVNAGYQAAKEPLYEWKQKRNL